MNALVALRPHINRFVAGRGGYDCAFVGVDVVQLGPCALLRFAHAHGFARQELRNLSITGVEITSDDGMLWADHDARRLQANLGSMRAEVALRRSAFVGIDINGIVWTGLHTGLAADAAFGAEIDDAVFALVHRGDRTDRHAGRIFTVVASGDLKDAPGVGIRSLLDILHPSAIYGKGNMVLGFAGHGAGMAANALAVIDDKPVSHPDVSLRHASNPPSGLCIVSDGGLAFGAAILQGVFAPLSYNSRCVFGSTPMKSASAALKRATHPHKQFECTQTYDC